MSGFAPLGVFVVLDFGTLLVLDRARLRLNRSPGVALAAAFDHEEFLFLELAEERILTTHLSIVRVYAARGSGTRNLG